MMHDMVEPSGSASITLLATAASSGKRSDAAVAVARAQGSRQSSGSDSGPAGDIGDQALRPGKEARPQQIAALQRYGQSE